MKWQPIGSAPKGDDLLVYCPDAREPKVIVAALLTYDDNEGGEFDEWHDVWAETGLEVEPTHWSPLPGKPA